MIGGLTICHCSYDRNIIIAPNFVWRKSTDQINYSETRERYGMVFVILLVRYSTGTEVAFPDPWLIVPSRISSLFLTIQAMTSLFPFLTARFQLQFHLQNFITILQFILDVRYIFILINFPFRI